MCLTVSGTEIQETADVLCFSRVHVRYNQLLGCCVYLDYRKI